MCMFDLNIVLLVTIFGFQVGFLKQYFFVGVFV